MEVTAVIQTGKDEKEAAVEVVRSGRFVNSFF